MTIVLLLALWVGINVAVVTALVRSRGTGRLERVRARQSRSFSAT
jgi:hypothetical protein